jgi:hypothetical protein
MVKFSKLQVFKTLMTASGLAATAFLAACADNGGNKSSPLEKPLSQQERIEASLKKVFPSYDLRDGKNMNLAGRLVGASAEVEKAISALPGAKAIYTVQVQALVRGLGTDEIIALTSRGQLETPAPVTLRNDVICSSPEIAGRFAVQSACHGDNCNVLIVRILERMTEESSGRRLETLAEQKLEEGSQTQEQPAAESAGEKPGDNIRQAVLVFKRQASRSSDQSGLAPHALEWAASGDPRSFFGGLKTSYAKAIEVKANQGNLKGKIALEPHQTTEGSECLAIVPEQPVQPTAQPESPVGDAPAGEAPMTEVPLTEAPPEAPPAPVQSEN